MSLLPLPPVGRFITFEGGDGSGKTTQSKRLQARLAECGVPSLWVREPGGTEGAELIRALLVSGAKNRWSPMTELLLHSAARRDHLERVVMPALDAGTWVVSDRYIDSTDAYQGAGHNLGFNKCRRLYHEVVGSFLPDLTIVLDVDLDTGLERAMRRMAPAVSAETRYEEMSSEFHARVHQAYRDATLREPQRCRLVDARGSEDAVHAAVWELVVEWFSPYLAARDRQISQDAEVLS